MRYTLTPDDGKDKKPFKSGMAYDDREIVRLARRVGFYVTRPNGSQRIRGSGRLLVWNGDRIVARFVRQELRESKSRPEPVGTIRGRLI